MKEIFVYGLVGISSLIMLAYTVHMFVGGLVSEQTEYTLMAVAVIIGTLALALMARDVIKRRRSNAGTSAGEK